MTARAALADELHLEPSSTTRTFVLEAHAADGAAYLGQMFGLGAVRATDDAFLFRVAVPDGEMWVDQLDSRFWSFHTDLPIAPVKRMLHEQVQARRDLDWLWLPSQHLRRVSSGSPARSLRTDFSAHDLRGSDAPGTGLKLQATGQRAERLLDFLAASEEYRSAVSLEASQVNVDDGDGGTVTEAVNRKGVFLASGSSLDTHLQFVRTVVARYAAFIELLEAKSIGWDPLDPDQDGGAALTGGPVGIRFSEPIPDLQFFVDELLGSAEPFRLWGAPVINDDVAEIDAVDLHVGQRLRMDVGRTWMRVYLERGGCGNTVARLVSNLQHKFDSRLELSDPALHAAMTAGTSTTWTPGT